MDVLMVGLGLDTNGQKMRFVRAAEKWGSDPDVLKALIVGDADLAGVGGRFALAAEKSKKVSIRSAHVAEAYFRFPKDMKWDRSTAREVQDLANAADVLHLTNDTKPYTKLGQFRLRKPALLHHHGTLFRNYPSRLLSEARRFNMLQAVSTIDLQRRAPDLLHWLPTAYDLDALAEIRAKHRRPDDGRVRIVQAPTNLEIKGTALLKATVQALQAEGLPVDLELVTNQTWEECLHIKATADIYFDQLGLGYGCNAVEAWGMGIPVIAGADPWTLNRMQSEFGGQLPFYTATEDTLATDIRAMVQSSDLRAEWAGIGSAHAFRFHAEKPALTRLVELYGMAIDKAATATEWGTDEYPDAAGRFRTTLRPNLMVAIGNQQVRFTDGEVQLDDPRMAGKMRRIAAFRSKFQISEVFDEDAA